MATSRRRTAKKDVGQNLGELESRVKKVERRPRVPIGSYSITSDLIAPGSITIDKLDPALLALLQDIADNAGSAGDSSEYIVSGGENGDGLVTGVVDSVISQFDFSTTSASGKNSIYWQDTAPTGGEYVEGDIWYDTSLSPVDNLPQYTPHQYKDGAWVAAEFGDGAFRFIDAAKISTGILDAGVAIRVGTYPLTNALVGKSRVEIAATFPTREAASGEDPATIPTFSGIRVLRKTASNQTETTGFYPSLLINADTGDFRVGSADKYFSYTASTDKVILSGTILTGADVNGNATSESLLVGSDVSDGKDGIRLGPYNYWYRPNSVSTSSDLIFKVGSSGAEGLTVTKAGAVTFEGTANPTGGDIKGAMTVTGSLQVGTGTQSLKLGKNVGTSNADGLQIGPDNYWYRPESVQSQSLVFQVSDGTATPTYIRLKKDGKVTFSGEITTGTTTTGPILTVNGFSFGKDVDGTKDGLKLNSGNFWYLPSTVADGQPIFNIASGGPNSTTTYISVNKGGEVLIKGYIQGGVIEGPISTTPTPGGGTMRLGVDVSGSSDGLYLNANNYWFVPDSVSAGSPILQIGDSSSAITFTPANGSTPSLLRVSGEIQSTSGFIGGWSLSSTGLVSGSGANAVGLISSGTQDTAIFAGFNFSVSRTGVLTASNAILSGSITANSGTIAGWSIQTLSIESNGGSVGMSSSNATNAVSFWAGSSTPSSAPFRVQNDGDLWATNATVTGTVNATAGYFGADSANGWAINSNTLKSKSVSGKSITLDSANARIFIYDEATTPAYNSASTSFYVDNAGYFSIGNNLYYNPVGGDGLPILTVAGRIRGSIDNVAVVPKDSNQFVIQSISVSGSGTQTVVLTTFLNHTFAVGNTVSISGLTGTVIGLNGTRTITARTANTITFTGAFGIAASTYTGSSVTTGTVGLTISSVVISTSSGTQSAVITMSGTHAFAVGDTVIVSGLTGGGAAAEGAWVVTAKTTNTFTISGLSGTDGTYTGLSGTARVRELTMGLHPAYNGAPGGIGLRLDENNYWFINNLFRVGSPISFMSWDGATLAVTGTVNATAGNFRNTVTVGSNATLTNRITIVGGDTAASTRIYSGVGTYANANTPFYIDASGSFSLGTSLQFTGGSLSITGAVTATSGSFSGSISSSSGNIGGWSIGSTTISSSSVINTVTYPVALSSSGTWAFYAGNATAANAPFRVGFDGTMVATNGTFTGSISGGSISGTSITGVSISGASASFGRTGNLTTITTSGGSLSRTTQTGASTTGNVSSTEAPTVEIVADTNSSGYLSFYRPASTEVGIQFYVNTAEGGSAGSGYLRSVIDHTSDQVTGTGGTLTDGGGTLRIQSLGSSSGSTAGRILLQANNSITGSAGKIDIRATDVYLSSFTDKGTSAGLSDSNASGPNFRMVGINVFGTAKGKLGQGPKITYGNNTSPPTTNLQDGDLHFSW